MRSIMLIALGLAVAAASGCGTVVSQGAATVMGASGRVFEIKDLGPKGTLDKYNAVQIEAFDPSPMLGSIPPDVVADVQPEIIRKLRETRLFSEVGARAGAKPALVIRGKFMDYDPGGSAARVVGVGSNPMLTAQIEVLDADSKRVLGVAMVSGVIKSVVRANRGELADGMAKAVRDLLQSGLQRKPPKER